MIFLKIIDQNLEGATKGLDLKLHLSNQMDGFKMTELLIGTIFPPSVSEWLHECVEMVYKTKNGKILLPKSDSKSLTKTHCSVQSMMVN